jgi:hypothetical protein
MSSMKMIKRFGRADSAATTDATIGRLANKKRREVVSSFRALGEDGLARACDREAKGHTDWMVA